jgi:hypothetical protein
MVLGLASTISAQLASPIYGTTLLRRFWLFRGDFKGRGACAPPSACLQQIWRDFHSESAFRSGAEVGLRAVRSALSVFLVPKLRKDSSESLPTAFSGKSLKFSRHFKGHFSIGNVQVRILPGQPGIPRFGEFPSVDEKGPPNAGFSHRHRPPETDVRTFWAENSRKSPAELNKTPVF